jgi:hypothetical protein
MDNTRWAAALAISIANLPPVKRMPPIVNLQFIADMGRMSGELLSAEATGSTSGASRPDHA